ncbi:AAA family ATPase [Acinetobacter sp. 1124_18A]|uniref:AAA family ATPase n=1 Tax=Acinetobacter sp. 1124_18A TaxID=2605958 RepID=UPI004059FA6A
MKILEPTIEIVNLLIRQDNNVVFLGNFKAGLNVITGSNSSGKTTILDLIAYTLGMEDVPLKKEALSCDESYLELKINGSTILLKREISDVSRRPISIAYEKLDINKIEEYKWNLFQMNRSEKISYSQIFFNLMDNKETNLEASSDLTVHQILRCIYAAQPFIHSPILTTSLFDDALTRKTIGEYLLGFYNNDLYIKEVTLKEKVKEKSKTATELNFLKNIFKKSIFTFSNKTAAEKRILKLEEQLLKYKEELVNKRKTPKKIENENLKTIEKINKDLNTLVTKKRQLENEKNQLSISALDSQFFINELIDRLDRLDESEFIQNVSKVNFEFCPSCLSKLEHSPTTSCNLCKCVSENEDETDTSPLLRMKNELLIQIDESKKININREKKINEIIININTINGDINSLSHKLNSLTEHWTDQEKLNISNLSISIGQIDNEIKEINKILPLYEETKYLEDKIEDLTSDISILESEIKDLEEESHQQKIKTMKQLNNNLANLLKQDTPREKEFINPTHINISFRDNQIFINNKNKFSESSMVILRQMFHLALLQTADQIETMRFPRFLILDGIDDGGIEPERNINLQKVIKETVDSFKNKSQIILATSVTHLNEELKPFIYNRIFTAESKSLNLQ